MSNKPAWFDQLRPGPITSRMGITRIRLRSVPREAKLTAPQARKRLRQLQASRRYALGTQTYISKQGKQGYEKSKAYQDAEIRVRELDQQIRFLKKSANLDG